MFGWGASSAMAVCSRPKRSARPGVDADPFRTFTMTVRPDALSRTRYVVCDGDCPISTMFSIPGIPRSMLPAPMSLKEPLLRSLGDPTALPFHRAERVYRLEYDD